MKSFTQYLKESLEEKKYSFKIKIAGDLPENCEDCMEAALQQFQVSRFTKGKSTPIQATLTEFPNVKNMSMTVFEAELDYPATSAVISELIATSTGVSRDCIKVRTLSEEQSLEEEEAAAEAAKDGKPLLNQDYEKSNNQDMVGEKHVSNFLKELNKIRKDTQPVQYKGVNDQLLAKTLPKGKKEEISKPGPARSVFSASKGK
jgi:hypothetical protein